MAPVTRSSLLAGSLALHPFLALSQGCLLLRRGGGACVGLVTICAAVGAGVGLGIGIYAANPGNYRSPLERAGAAIYDKITGQKQKEKYELPYYRYVVEAELNAIRTSNGILRGGRVGRTYLADTFYNDAAVAYDKLALPTMPTHGLIFRILNEAAHPRSESGETGAGREPGRRGNGVLVGRQGCRSSVECLGADLVHELTGKSVAIEVDEPFELIAEDDLTIHGNVTEVMVQQDSEMMWIAIESDDPRLKDIHWMSASPRYEGDSFASLAPASPLIVNGAFFSAQGEGAVSRCIGLLKIVSS